MRSTTYYYLQPKKDFFKKGYRGSVIHALGIYHGFKQNGISLRMLHYGGLNSFGFFEENIQLRSTCKTFFFLLRLLKNKENRLIVRYSMSNVFQLYLLALFSGNQSSICLEINTLGKMYLKKNSAFGLVGFFEKKLLRLMSNIYVVSEGAKTFIENEYKIEGRNIIVLPNALIEFDSNSVPVGTSNQKRLVYFGSLHGYYDIESICSWVKDYNTSSVQSIEVHLYGNDDNDKLHNLKKEFGDFIIAHGTYNNADIFDLVGVNDILILPYKSGTIAEYGSPTKLFEYMAMGLPIISSDVGQLSDILKHNQTVMLYSDKTAFLEALDTLQNNLDFARNLGINARNEVANGHTWKHRIIQLIKEWK